MYIHEADIVFALGNNHNISRFIDGTTLTSSASSTANHPSCYSLHQYDIHLLGRSPPIASSDRRCTSSSHQASKHRQQLEDIHLLCSFCSIPLFNFNLTARLGKTTPRIRANGTYYAWAFAHRAHVPCGLLHPGTAGQRDMPLLTDVYKLPLVYPLLHLHHVDVLN